MAQNARRFDYQVVGRSAVRWTGAVEWYRSQLGKFRKGPKDRTPEAIRQSTPKNQRSEAKKLDTVVDEAEDTLAKSTSVWPFALFGTTICLDRHKLTIIERTFFRTANVVSVPIDNIKNIQAHVGPLFGSLVITSDHFVNNTQEVKYLWRRDAEKMQKLVQGAVLAISEEVDISKISPGKLKKSLSRLGQGLES